MSKLSDVNPQKSDYIPDKTAKQIMAILDRWIDEIENYCKPRMELAWLESQGHDQLRAECLDSIASVKEFRSSIQIPSAEQGWAVLTMLDAVHAQATVDELVHTANLHLKTGTARLKKIEKEIKRRRWLSKRIKEGELTAEDLLGSGKKPKRTKLLGEYLEEFDKKSSRTFTADVKTLFDLAD